VEWTDDLSVRLARGTSVSMLVDYLSAAMSANTPRAEILGQLTERFALSFDDARLTMDRVQGGITRAMTRDPANEPDPIKDPVAWTSYRRARGLKVIVDDLGPSPEVEAAAIALVEGTRSREATCGTEDVAVALEVARLAIEPTERDEAAMRVLLEAATCVSVAAEACIDRLGPQPCAAGGSQDWVDGVQLAAAARAIAGAFARGGDTELEQRSYDLAGRIVTRLLGQSHALVGRAMLDSARCMQRNGDPEGAADRVDPVIADFQSLLDEFAHEAPFDEYRIGIEYLLAAVGLIIDVRGSNPELDDLSSRARGILALTPNSY
jgi:hypothetical protein